MYIFFAYLTKVGIILIHSHWVAIVVLAVIIFIFDDLRQKKSMFLAKESGITCFKNFYGILVENC